jgi:hypothetical protein
MDYRVDKFFVMPCSMVCGILILRWCSMVTKFLGHMSGVCLTLQLKVYSSFYCGVCVAGWLRW